TGNYFFFQAEDGIRDFHVTGVQTCALPIWVALVDRTRARPAGRGCGRRAPPVPPRWGPRAAVRAALAGSAVRRPGRGRSAPPTEIGRASCRERGEIWAEARTQPEGGIDTEQ